jgi:hypothetical protein
MAATDVEGSGTADDPWILTTPPGKSEFEAHRDLEADGQRPAAGDSVEAWAR